MSKPSLAFALSTAALLAGGAAAAHPGHGPAPSDAGVLPDFPPNAQPGACYARKPSGVNAQHGTGMAPDVWTVQRGAGPTAVWSFSQGGASSAVPRHGPLDWAQVDCRDGRAIGPAFHAEALGRHGPDPRAPMEHPPVGRPPVARSDPMMQQGSFNFPSPPEPPIPHAMNEPPTMEDFGPYADVAPVGPGAGMHRFVIRRRHEPAPHAGFAPHGPAPHGPAPHDRAPDDFVMHAPMPTPHDTPQDYAPQAYAPRVHEQAPALPFFGGRMLSWPGKTPR